MLGNVHMLAYFLDTWWGRVGFVFFFLKNFPLQRLHFILREAFQDFGFHINAWLCLLFS